MHCLRQAKKTASRCAALFAAALALAITVPAAAAGAADTEVAAAEAAADAVTGHVYVRAAVEEGYEADISVCLIAGSKGGTVYEYRLNAENRYGISDDIAEGSYVCVPFITDPDPEEAAYVEYGGGEKEVSREKDACFLVVAGSADFVRDYLWLSDFRDENGEYLKGVVSRRDAEEAFLETVAGQREQPGEHADPEGSGPEEVAATDAPPAPVSPVPGQEPGTGDAVNVEENLPPVLPAAAAACLAACLTVWLIRKRR